MSTCELPINKQQGMSRKCIVLDTNCLLQCLSRRNSYYDVWEAFVLGKYTLCVSTEILEEYEEIISSHMSPVAAKLAIEMILRARNVLRVDAQFRFHLITADEDDNKFVDCAIVANAEYIVSNDKHFNALASIPFPHVEVRTLSEFQKALRNPWGRPWRKSGTHGDSPPESIFADMAEPIILWMVIISSMVVLGFGLYWVNESDNELKKKNKKKWIR